MMMYANGIINYGFVLYHLMIKKIMLNMWIIRDKNGTLILSYEYPKRHINVDTWHRSVNSMVLCDSDYPMFRDVKWEDEPIEVELSNANRRFIRCDKCGKAFSYLPRDVHSFTVCLQPSSVCEDGYEYVNCPHCKSEVYI